MKKWIIMIMTLLFISGCQSKSEKEIVRIYLPEHEESWIMNGSMEEAVKDERIDEVNRILKENGKKYQIEIRVISNDQEGMNSNGIQNKIDQLKELENNHADITLFDQNLPVYHNFEVLDEEITKDNGKKLMEQLPEHLLEANKMNGKMYYIPKVTLPYHQLGFSFDYYYYQENQSDIKGQQKDPVMLLGNLIDTYEMKKNEVLFLNIRVEMLLMESYENIKGTPLFIRREDKKVINPLEDADFMEVYSLLIKGHLKGVSGRFFTQEEWDHFYEKGKEILFVLDTFTDKDTAFGKIQTDRKEFSIGEKIPTVTSGLGVLKKSEHKEAAFDFLCEMNTNQDIANVLIYGKDPEKDESGSIITSEKSYIEGMYRGILGNDMITDPAITQKEDKKRIVFHNDTLSISKLVVPTVLDLEPISKSVDRLNEIWSNFDSITNNYNDMQPRYQTVEEAMKQFDEENQKLKEAGMDEVISELQRQVDTYGQDGA